MYLMDGVICINPLLTVPRVTLVKIAANEHIFLGL